MCYSSLLPRIQCFFQEVSEKKQEGAETEKRKDSQQKNAKGLLEVKLPAVMWPYHESYLYCVLGICYFFHFHPKWSCSKFSSPPDTHQHLFHTHSVTHTLARGVTHSSSSQLLKCWLQPLHCSEKEECLCMFHSQSCEHVEQPGSACVQTHDQTVAHVVEPRWSTVIQWSDDPRPLCVYILE